MNPNEIDLANISSDDDGGGGGGDGGGNTIDETNIITQMGFSSFGPQDRASHHRQQHRPSKRNKPNLRSEEDDANKYRPGHTSGGVSDSKASVPASAATTAVTEITSPFPTDPAEAHRPATLLSTGQGDLSTEPGVSILNAPPSSNLSGTASSRSISMNPQPPDLKPGVAANATGDPVYWDRSFIEDPWAELSPRRWGSTN